MKTKTQGTPQMADITPSKETLQREINNLKASAYDAIKEIERISNILNQINVGIAERDQAVAQLDSVDKG